MSKEFETIIKSDPNDPVAQFIKVIGLHIKFSSKINIKILDYIKTRYPDIWNMIEKYIIERIYTFTNIFILAQEKGCLRNNIDPVISAKLFENILNTSMQPDFMMKKRF